MGLVGVHLLVLNLNSTKVQPGSRNLLAVAPGVQPPRCAATSGLLESTQVQTSIRNVLAVALHLLGM